MTASLDSLTETVRAIVGEVLSVPAADLPTDTDLREVEGADSIKVLRLIARIEREYDVELEDEDVFGVSSIAEIADVVRKALETR
ncbi:acyl carrier protein [Pseudonocardia sp. WMMC193]|uniref:acyl carrier protein n=1 Tax=Pseudonocardia sp. WMMC193 TaxID=2911965 RepID=UPI001F213103|nr:acyl carrier protein [Pseudonocardia sp. WMMC193]MCF7548541.1 acyl carrier protein [Pseudonocardia sp. WMMC193]